MQGEEAGAGTEAVASYPEDPDNIINEGGSIKQQVFSVDETPYIGRRSHLGLS